MSDERFLGMTRTQFLTLLVGVLAATVLCLSIMVVRLWPKAQLGAETHTALCVEKRDYQRQVEQSLRFLRMTVPAREHEFGKALGDIPPIAVRHGLISQQANVRSLRSLSC